MKIRINNDLYDIASRVKEIDPRYEIYFETESQKFTLWAAGKRQLTFPFENLDERALVYARKTRIENMEEVIKEIDSGNEKYEKDRLVRVQDKIEDEYSRRLRLAGV
ncbi:MAG: hypothetical protein J5781_02815 [Clostridia bacterium]|nr:hypothetical protein [Clostridia bacterium]